MPGVGWEPDRNGDAAEHAAERGDPGFVTRVRPHGAHGRAGRGAQTFPGARVCAPVRPWQPWCFCADAWVLASARVRVGVRACGYSC